MHYIKIKKKEIDQCNICGEIGKMTWDHVPPKSSGNNLGIKVNTLFEGLPTETSYQKNFQSGIKFRSLCQKCNGEILSRYDKAYVNFIDDVKQILNSSIILPEVVQVPVQINKVCRAICGHILAAKDFFDKSSLIDKELRKFVLDENYKIGPDYRLYFWIYPYNSIMIVRDVVVKSYTDKVPFPKGVITCISSFPIAFILSVEDNDKCGLHNLMKYRTNNIDDIVNIPIDFRSSYYLESKNIRNFLWPCNIGIGWDEASFVIGGESMNDSRLGITSLNKKGAK